jgi:hypothetical protein
MIMIGILVRRDDFKRIRLTFIFVVHYFVQNSEHVEYIKNILRTTEQILGNVL